MIIKFNSQKQSDDYRYGQREGEKKIPHEPSDKRFKKEILTLVS